LRDKQQTLETVLTCNINVQNWYYQESLIASIEAEIVMLVGDRGGGAPG
jgi:hypothetical protein